MEAIEMVPQGARRATAFSCLVLLAATAQAASISEVFYDAAGSDGGNTFIELTGRPGETLDGLQLVGVNGSNGADYLVIDLSGTMPADGVLLIADGSEDTSAIHGAQIYTRADLQNGPDSLQLRRGDQVIDAVGYGDFSNAVFAGFGMPAIDVSAGNSLTRIAWTGDNASDYIEAEPSTGTAVTAPVPVPGALWLFASGLLALATRSGSRS